ncbi:MAG: hypothetical protein ACRDXE_11415 [Acidimicrobiales bacterium]
MQPTLPLTIDGFDYEVDSYSIVDGAYTEDFAIGGGSIVLRGRIGQVAATATVSAANLPQALGHALTILMSAQPAAGTASLEVTGYVDNETGSLTEVDRHETPASGR